ncbi:huntingtin-interacting 1-like protein [Labeo rohita]|uniref:Huntingtin-interacting 1-like protein n=1 Tax=Labeo rohita TaxID=84645 RepID=A0A498M312_LABRO|nr:huntingtin-interacting 1-like protein [Labeo rohita]
MDRVKSSMQQVPNPIPKVLSRRTGGANSLEVEKENFERNQVIKDSMRHKADLNDMSRMWGHLSEGYGKLCSIYLKLLITKMEFHIKNPRFPGNLQMSNRQLDEAGENDVNNFFQLTVEMFDYLECELNLFLGVFSSLDMSRSVSVTAAGQCRLAPLIQVILDSSHLYDYTVKLLFKLHSCLPADTLQGHRDRFQEQFKKLKSLFYRSSNLQYFKRLIQIPQLPENPPNFLRASALSEHISPVVVIPVESSSPESEHVVETEDLVDTDIPPLPSAVDSKFDDLFGTSAATDPFNFNSQNGMRKDEKDRLIEQLTAELQALKEELESFRLESGRLCQALRGRVNELEAELAEQTHLKQQALGESEFLRAELDDLRRVKEDTEKEQRSLSEIERKAQANEQRYTKLKEKYTELVQSHADLLRKIVDGEFAYCIDTVCALRVAQLSSSVRPDSKPAGGLAPPPDFCSCRLCSISCTDETWHCVPLPRLEAVITLAPIQPHALIPPQRHPTNAEVTRQMTVARAAQDEVENVKKEMQDKLKAAQDTASHQSNDQLSTQLSALEAEKVGLMETVSKKEAELANLGVELERVQSSLTNERESGVKAAESLQNQLNEKESREQALESELVTLRWAALRAALEEAGRIVQDSLNQLEDPAHISCTSSADYLVSRCQVAVDCVERLRSARDGFVSDNTDVSGLVRAVTQFAHLVGDVIVQGSATSHMVPVEQADALADNVKACGAEALALLCQLKEQESMGTADCSRLRAALDTVMALGEKLRPRGLELQQGELGDMVEQEMAATSAAVESAAARIEEMLNKSRAVDTGIKMEVNERILASCTDLMQAIKVLVLSSKDLQRDIVESGRGAASMKEFYAKNSRWTEGLISASKAVGWGATMLVDAADQVVQGKGKFEELMVCSHEIAASTAQLVAASKVKADKGSSNLSRLQQASKGVTQATAGVVASTKSGKSQIEDTETMDFSTMTLTQIKRQEMDAQVLVLELETRLQKERERLGELRKKHYELAGVAEGWGGEEEVLMQFVNFRGLPDFSQLAFSQHSGQVFFGLTAAFGQGGGLTVHCEFTNLSSFIDELIATFQKMSFSNGTRKVGEASPSYSECQGQTLAFGQTLIYSRTRSFQQTPGRGQTCTYGRTQTFWKTPASSQALASGQAPVYSQTPAFWQSLAFKDAKIGQPSSSIDELTAAFQRVCLSVKTSSRKRPATALCRLGMDTDDTVKMSRPCKRPRCF